MVMKEEKASSLSWGGERRGVPAELQAVVYQWPGSAALCLSESVAPGLVCWVDLVFPVKRKAEEMGAWGSWKMMVISLDCCGEWEGQDCWGSTLCLPPMQAGP